MLKAPYYQSNGGQDGKYDLPEWLFDGVINENVLHQVIRSYLLNQRQGNGAAKSRGQVAGGSSKPWRQKGTGRARQGTIRAAQWAGGGVAFPPIPHSWRQRVPKKVKSLARRSAFNTRAQGEQVIVVETIEFEFPKTKQLKTLFSTINAEGKVLVLTDGPKKNVYLAARNLPNAEVRPFGQESAYDILWSSVVVIEKDALDGAEPSEMDIDAMRSLKRVEPKVRIREMEVAEAQAKSEKALDSNKKITKPEVFSEGTSSESRGIESKDDFDVANIKLPKVSEMRDFLAQFDSVNEVKDLQARDNRKTAQAHYNARLLELSDDADYSDGDHENA
jgi:large subunit ribosomal protein L4